MSSGADADRVSKTDIINYHRCSYAFWLIETGEVSVEEAQPRLVAFGENFERSVLAKMVGARPKPLTTQFKEDHFLYDLPLFKNNTLCIWGRPDGVHTAAGGLEPIEIKSHSKVAFTDRLELAFYWLLLEPWRTRHSATPRGFVRLRRDSVPRPVVLLPADFARVKGLIDLVRRARRIGVRPRPCDCQICSERIEVKAFKGRIQLQDLYGMGAYANGLRKIGVSTIARLLASESLDITRGLSQHSLFTSASIVDGWKAQAQAWRRAPVRFGTERFTHEQFILLDLEYDCLGGQCGDVWLTGIHIRNGFAKTIQIWSLSEFQRRAAMAKLFGILAKYRELPIVTWSGQSAELPQLRALAKFLSIDGLTEAVARRHVDLLQFTQRNIRLPIPSYRLKNVAEYFGFEMSASLKDGLDATIKYRLLRTTKSRTRREHLRGQLEAYNCRDLMRLKLVAERFCELAGPVRASTKA